MFKNLVVTAALYVSLPGHLCAEREFNSDSQFKHNSLLLKDSPKFFLIKCTNELQLPDNSTS